MAARNEITKPTLQRLARMRADGPRVLSVYLNLDPERFATAPARASAVRSLIDDAHRQAESVEASLEHEQAQELRADLDRVAEHLQAGGFTEGAAAHAVFCCRSLDLFEALSLPEPVENLVTIDEVPFIAPLLETGPPGRWCVALVNRRVTRVMRGSAENLSEVLAFGDNVHGQHSQGGWSQARYSRSVQRDVDDHLRRTAHVLLRQFHRRPFGGLLIAAPEELRKQLEAALHPYVRERLAGFIDLDVENSTEEQVRAEAAKAIEARDAELVRERLARLRAELGSDGRAAAGPERVLASLHERRVGTLLFEQGKRIPGGVCPNCGLMRVNEDVCPVDGTQLEHRDDLLEPAMHAAVGQDADVLPVEEPDLGPLGGIAALLRF